MTDVERVLLVLLPALSLLAGCDKPTPKSGDSADPVKTDEPDPEPEPPTTAVITDEVPESDTTPTGTAPNETDGDEPQPEDDPDPKPDTKPDPVKTVEQPLPDMNMPSCPTDTWCGSRADSDAIADKGKRVLDCAPSISPDLKSAGKPNYSGLSSYQAFFDRGATDSKRKEGTADSCCYTWTIPCPGGRPLLDGAGVAVRAAPLSRLDSRDLQHSGRPDINDPVAAAQWLEDAAMEHASVASFNRAALELLSVGAPLDLVRRCQQAALDELDHVETCLALASRCGAAPTRFGALALPELRAPELARLAADTFEEGCVGETIATLAMKRAASKVDDAGVAARIAGIADDELRHAELAWETIAWAVHTGGPEVLAAVRNRAAGLRPDFAAALLPARPAAGATAQTAATGRLDARAATLVALDAWRSIIDPLLSQLDAEQPAPAC